jgi:sporulation protein YlmC with PRC-barrel domain
LLFAHSASAAATETPAAQPARACVTDLTAFDGQLQKDGYWLHGSGYGYGYPMYGYGDTYGAERPAGARSTETTGYLRGRPGYEVRTLLAAANIQAQRGDQVACESSLSSARQIYSTYAEDLRNGKVPKVDLPSWRRQQIAAAVAVTGDNAAFRSDQLVGAAVVNPQGDALGSVDDIVISPQSGKIAYLVIGRGGIFGIDEKYVPIPWEDFKAAPGNKLLVLATAKATMDAAPQVKENQNLRADGFAAESLKVNAYWVAHLAP